MAIKWKNKYIIFLAAFLMVLGSMVAIHNNQNNRARQKNDYRLENELSIYLGIDMLERFDENTLQPEMVPDYLVDEYRYQYGDLESQVKDIKNQYQAPIKQAKEKKDKSLIADLEKERDEKLLAIVANFTSNQAVKEKIVKRDTEKILKLKPEILKNLVEQRNSDYVDENYAYYFLTKEGFELTNLKTKPSGPKRSDIEAAMEEEGVRRIKKSVIWGELSDELGEIQTTSQIGLEGDTSSVDGYIAVKKGSALDEEKLEITSQISRQKMLHTVGISVLLVGIICAWNYLSGPIYYRKQAAYIQKIPLDARLLCLVIIGLTAWLVKMFSPRLPLFSVRTIIFFMCAYIVVGIALGLLKDLWLTVKKERGYLDFASQAKLSFSYQTIKKIRRWFSQLSTTVKIFLLFSYFSLVGSATLWVIYEGGMLEVAIIMVVLLCFIGSLPLIFREYRLTKLLKKPQEILHHNEEEAESSLLLEDVSKNLEKLGEIVSATHDNRQRSETLKTELLTNVSHDLRTPLTSIISYGDLLTKANLQEEDRQAYTEIINRKAMRMKNLIDDLFDVTKMANGEITLNRTEINLGQLIQQSIAEYGEELSAKELKMIDTKPEEELILSIDGDQMWRVFDNLIGNVVKYGMPRTRVYLKTEATASEVKIELKNISLFELNEDGNTLVERFTRGDEARNTEGSGLGLAIANSIVNLHGGLFEIIVDGDMFKITIRLPREINLE